MRWMNLEPIIQSEVSQKEKDCILTRICRIQKNGAEEFIYRAAMEKQTQMKLEFVTQSEVSQKEKNKYHMLTHIYGIQKNGTDELI